jgi:hypothetical protein
MVHCHTHNSPPLAPVPSPCFHIHFWKIHFNIILPPTPPQVFQVISFLQVSSPKPPVRAKRPAQFILLDLFTRITFVGKNAYYEVSDFVFDSSHDVVLFSIHKIFYSVTTQRQYIQSIILSFGCMCRFHQTILRPIFST